jgi:hypothetical protein
VLNRRYPWGLLLVVLCMAVPFARAQDSDASSSRSVDASDVKPAATGSPVLPQQDVVADTLPLSGVQDLTLGLPAPGHSFLLPSFGIATTVQTNPYVSGQPGFPGTIESTYLTTRLELNRSSASSLLSLQYLGGGTFSNDSNRGTTGIQNLAFSDLIHWGRWSVTFGDQANYMSQSPFGFGGLGGLNGLGVGLGNGVGSSSQFRTNFLPNQSILLNGFPQVSNAVIGELDYAVSRRSSLTFAGSYGILNFLNNGFQNSSSATFQGGYNHQLDRMNSIAVFYRFDNITFSGLSQTVQDHGVELSYARRITGSLSFQAGAGPDILVYRSPTNGDSAIASWMASSSLRYQRQNFGTGFNYDHSLTGGSGILAGAKTDLFSGFLNQSLSRNWGAELSTGYARNQVLQQGSLNSWSIAPQTWFATVRIDRHFVQYGSLYFSYTASGQTGLTGVCAQPACLANTLTHTIALGYNWGLHPTVLE